MMKPKREGSKDASTSWPTLAASGLAFLASLTAAWWAYQSQVQVAQLQDSSSFTKDLASTSLADLTSLQNSKSEFNEVVASSELFALFSKAKTAQQFDAILSIAGQLLNASPRSDTGGPASRFIEAAIGQLQTRSDDKDAANALVFVHSAEFLDLISSEVSRRYYSDDQGPDEWPTELGDQDITNDGKRLMWVSLTSSSAEGWISVGTVLIEGRTSRTILDYTWPAIETASGARFMINRARYLRDEPPHVGRGTDDEKRGVLGRVVGAADAGQCVSNTEDAQIVSVAVPSKLFVAALHSIGRTVAQTSSVVELQHIWAHIRFEPPASCH